MAGFEYFQGRFDQEADQSGTRVDLDRTRRVLSDGLFIFLSGSFHHSEKPEILPDNQYNSEKSWPIRPESGPELNKDGSR